MADSHLQSSGTTPDEQPTERSHLDGALFWKANDNLQLQLNVENLLDRKYFASAHSNQNISPGAPRGATLTARFTF